jgi:pyruvate dehydrogenase E1 component alpha subunit
MLQYIVNNKDLYSLVSLIRHAEMKIVEVYPTDIMQTPVHLSIGQESVAAALCSHLNQDDIAYGTHRGHGIYLAKGGDLKGFYAELLGRVDGCSGGYGGSMHLIDRSVGFYGTSSIVGGAIPIAVGAAMGIKAPRVVAVLFGDGASDEGVFYESLNFAKLKELPVIFVCENNRYSIYTHTCQRRCTQPHKIAEACNIRTVYMPIDISNDVVALHERLKEHIDYVRDGKGPLFVECETVRAVDHHGGGSDVEKGMRPQEEADLALRHDPMEVARRQLDPDMVKEVDREVINRIEEAFEAAMKSKPVHIEVDYEQLGNNPFGS